uniref:Small ribosomal subunit protein uS3m n=1 Tax=Phanerochaete carnosa TaxID=231932 RepID=A0A895KWB7_9APHY|nr:ribosomal protein S3 [Phanerochaete carnosa]QRZ60395.1 ribosomal protein S3 [Phanerochaete carnosa]
MKQTKLSEGHTTKFKFSPNLEPFYSSLLNQNIDLANTKTKVNSQSKFVLGNVNQEKSLKLRVLDITNLNKKINILSSIDRFSIGDIRSTNSNVGDKAVLSGEVLNQSIPALVPYGSAAVSPKLNILKSQPSTKINKGKNQLQSILTAVKQNRIKESKISKYLQTISNFEPEIAHFQNIVYNFNNNKKKFKLNSILENSFYTMKSLIGTPVYEITPNNITINLFYYLQKRFYGLNRKHIKYLFSKTNIIKPKLTLKYLKSLIFYLSKKFNKPINLDLTRLFHPTLDSQISANAIGIIATKFKRHYLRLSFKFFKSANIKNPTIIKNILTSTYRNSNKLGVVTGINLKKGGRLITQPLVPKLTSKIIQIGSINRANTEFVTTSRYTAKSKRGAFSITVTMGHKFF